MDEICIKGLRLFGYHGVYPEEEERGQDFYIDLKLFLSTQAAGISDELEDSISYEEVCEFVTAEFKKKRYRLIEAVAENLSCALFRKYTGLSELELKLSKPEAPLDAVFEDVSVTIRRKKHVVYIAYGANEGDSLRQIEDSIAMIDKDPFCKVVRMTRPIQSTPYGDVVQNDFYNGVLEIYTLYNPVDLMKRLHEIERFQGLDRDKKIHWGPRPLDLDILLYDNEVIDLPGLTVPHRDMVNRDFVMIPLAELAPHVRHPLLGLTIGELAKKPMEKHLRK